MNVKLKIALLKARAPSYEIAARAGISESRLSRIVTGRLEPSLSEQLAIAEAIGTSVAALFGERGDNISTDGDEGVE